MTKASLLNIALILFSGAAAFGQSWKSHLLQGNKYYKKDNFTEAEVSYKKALEKNQEAVEGVFNLGDALYNQDRYEEAIEQFELASKFMPSSKQQAQAWHNIGNAYLQQSELEKSKEAYIKALSLNPNDPNTKYNLSFVNELLRQKQQEQEQQQQNQEQQEQEQEEDQESQGGDQEQEQEGEQEQEQQPSEGELSKEQAEQLLDAIQRQEEQNQEDLEKKMRQVPAAGDNLKDW